MQVLDFLKVEQIHLHTAADSKQQLIGLLSKEIAAAVGLTEDNVQAQFSAREAQCSTAIGNGVAVPHIRIANLASPVCALFVLKQSIEFDSPDQKPVDLVFSLAAPESECCQHLQILSKVAELFSQTEFRDQLRHSQSSSSIYQLIHSACQHEQSH